MATNKTTFLCRKGTGHFTCQKGRTYHVLPTTLLFWGLTDVYPSRRYVVLHDGEGTIE